MSLQDFWDVFSCLELWHQEDIPEISLLFTGRMRSDYNNVHKHNSVKPRWLPLLADNMGLVLPVDDLEASRSIT